jgi:hypothetical protein
MYKLEFTLKQHTPIIHFQHDQDGATLRATEVKPKLDRFLIEKLKLTEIKTIEGKEKEVPKTEFESYFINGGKQHLALDYKMRIICDEKDIDKTILDIPYPCFFAAMGEEYLKSPKALSFSKTPIKVIIQSFNDILLEHVNKNVCAFFAFTNFGTRQSKGFGSYYPLDLDGKIDFQVAINSQFKFETKQINDKNALKDRFQYLFEDIDLFYKILKSGYNFPDHPKIDGKINYEEYGSNRTYYRAFFSIYMNEKGIGNEKRFIKENFFRRDVRLAKDGVQKRFIRAQLGLPDNYEFRGKDRRGKIEIKSSDVERFKSPLTFKVFENKVYLVFSNFQLPTTRFDFKDKFSEERISSPNLELNFEDLLQNYFIYFEECKTDFINKNKNKNLPFTLKLIYDSLSRIQPLIINHHAN